MNPWITIAAPAVLAAIVAFSIAYMHRKQMRQVELYRQDPKAGLLPPPSPPVRLIKSYWRRVVFMIGSVTIPSASIVYTLVSDRPVTNWSTAYIAFNVAILLYAVVTSNEARILRLLLTHSQQTGRLLTVVENMFERLNQIENRLDRIDPPPKA